MDEYISAVQKWVDKIQSSEMKTAAQEVVQILEAIRVRTNDLSSQVNGS
jgi:hypothetical protein